MAYPCCLVCSVFRNTLWGAALFWILFAKSWSNRQSMMNLKLTSCMEILISFGPPPFLFSLSSPLSCCTLQKHAVDGRFPLRLMHDDADPVLRSHSLEFSEKFRHMSRVCDCRVTLSRSFGLWSGGATIVRARARPCVWGARAEEN